MQSRLFRTTLRKFAETFPEGNKTQKRDGFVRKIVKDPGNIPILVANFTAVTLLVGFAFRKLFYHPDVSISDANRFSPQIQNEPGRRLEQAQVFRGQTRNIARALTGDEKDENSFSLTNAIMKLGGVDRPSDKFQLGFLKKTDISLPLEATDYFDDGLFVGNHETKYNANAANEKEFAQI
jgi:hypothetical protein